MTVMEDVTAKTDYDTIGGTDNTLKYVDTKTGQSRVLLTAKDLKGLTLRWSDDGRWFGYAKKGEIFVQGVDGSPARSLTPRPKAAAENAEDKKEEEESFSPTSFSRDGSRMLVTSKKGWYVLRIADATRKLIVPMDEDEEKNPRLSALDWSPDGRVIYATWGARDQWERGLVAIDAQTGAMTHLAKDNRLYSPIRLARSGNAFIVNVSDGDRPADLYATEAANSCTACCGIPSATKRERNTRRYSRFTKPFSTTASTAALRSWQTTGTPYSIRP